MKPIYWAVVIFTCAALFRVTNLDLIEFKLDEARDVYEMERLFEDPYLPERGTIQSTGVYNPPLWYYILAVLSLPSRDPQYLSFMIGLINSGAVVLFYLVVKRLDSREFTPDLIRGGNDRKGWFGIAEISALLLATSPWSILFSRKIWSPDIILPFVVVWFWCMSAIANKSVIPAEAGIQTKENTGSRVKPGMTIDKKWAWMGLVLVTSLIAQIHASGIFLAVGTGVSLLFFHSRSDRNLHSGSVFFALKYSLVGLVISLLPFLPYINYQIKTGCEDCRAFTSYQEGETIIKKSFDANAFLRPFQFITGSGFQVALGTEGYQAFVEQNPFARFLEFIFLLEFLLLPLGIWNIVHPGGIKAYPRGASSLWMVVILAVVPFLYFATQTTAHLYYFLILAPVIVVINAFGIIHLGGVRSRSVIPGLTRDPEKMDSREFTPDLIRGENDEKGVGMGLPIALISLITLINLAFTFSFYKFLGDVKVVPGEYGATFGVIKEQAQDLGMKVEEYIISIYQNMY